MMLDTRPAVTELTGKIHAPAIYTTRGNYGARMTVVGLPSESARKPTRCIKAGYILKTSLTLSPACHSAIN